MQNNIQNRSKIVTYKSIHTKIKVQLILVEHQHVQ